MSHLIRALGLLLQRRGDETRPSRRSVKYISGYVPRENTNKCWTVRVCNILGSTVLKYITPIWIRSVVFQSVDYCKSTLSSGEGRQTDFSSVLALSAADEFNLRQTSPAQCITVHSIKTKITYIRFNEFCGCRILMKGCWVLCSKYTRYQIDQILAWSPVELEI